MSCDVGMGEIILRLNISEYQKKESAINIQLLNNVAITSRREDRTLIVKFNINEFKESLGTSFLHLSGHRRGKQSSVDYKGVLKKV